MKPLDVKEWAESLLLGEYRDFAKEVLKLILIRDDYDEQNEWVEDVVKMVPDEFTSQGSQKSLHWVGDQLSMIEEIKERLEKSDFIDPDCSTVENIKALCDDYDAADDLLVKAGFGEGDVTDKVALALEKIPAADSADGAHDDIWQAGYDAAKKEFGPESLEYDL